MSKIDKINGNYKKPFLTPRNTGYAACGAILLSTTRAFSKAAPVARSHKFIGYIATALTLLHIGVVEYLHFKHKKM